MPERKSQSAGAKRLTSVKKEVKGDRMVTSKRRKFADIDSSVYRASTISALR